MLTPDRTNGGPIMLLDDVRKTIEATLSSLTPQKAQELAKGLLEPGTAKEQVSKTAAELMDWSHRNRERLREFVATEISGQMKTVGVATQAEVDGLKKRVRALEREAGMTASGKKPAARKTPARKASARKTSSKSTAANPTRAAS
jgi:polyhydroxyalkanoate synthesis regulator phasin